jgi:hypothetical protein
LPKSKVRIAAMAASTTAGSSMPTNGAYSVAVRIRVNRRRISPQSGRALEILGHAIEYLTDEFVHSGMLIPSNIAPLEAVQLLMGLNRQVYFECPEMLSLGERCRNLLKRCVALP